MNYQAFSVKHKVKKMLQIKQQMQVMLQYFETMSCVSTFCSYLPGFSYFIDLIPVFKLIFAIMYFCGIFCLAGHLLVFLAPAFHNSLGKVFSRLFHLDRSLSRW